MPSSFLPYHEPGIVTILIISCFFLALNLVNTAFDKLIYCGLIGQIFIGVAWGTPGAGWLGEALEEAIVQFGYIGLILLVYEGRQISHDNHLFSLLRKWLTRSDRWTRYQF